jgi:hypothetical protein
MPVHELAPKTGAAAGSDEQVDQQLRTILENLQQVTKEDQPVERDDLSLGIAPQLDREVLERNAIYDRLVAIENRMKRRSSRRFGRYLIAICVGVAGTLAWQSYGQATKQIIATRAPELGWSPEAKQTIASWTVGWMRPPAEKTAPEAVASSKAPPVPAIDSAQVQQIAQSLAALRETVGQIAASQDQTSREIARLESAVAELILKFPEPSAQPPAAPARKPPPAQPPSSRVPTAQPSSRPPQ